MMLKQERPPGRADAERPPRPGQHSPGPARRPQWVFWRLETRRGRRTKVPYQAGVPGRAFASTAKVDTWSTFDEAVARYQAGGMAGIGYVFAAAEQFAVFASDHGTPLGTDWLARI